MDAAAQNPDSGFSVIAFYTAKNDSAHISFVHEANQWFAETAADNNFRFDSTNNWNNLNEDFLRAYQVVIFLDTRPEKPEQREAFEQYMKQGGAWMGFHFAGFALTPSDYPQNWNWYHDTLIGTGQYKSNTWGPAPAVLRVEDSSAMATKGLPVLFRSAPNEWYRWEKDLRHNDSIKILLSIDSSSFPLGTGPKPEEIWHSGDYPVAWTNIHYKMIYFNMGHNDIDYKNKTYQTLSYQFTNYWQNRLVTDALFWLAGKSPPPPSRR